MNTIHNRTLHTQVWSCRKLWKRMSRYAVAVLAVATIGVQTESMAIDFNSSVAVNLGSGFTVPIVNNAGQLPPSIRFVAPGPTGNTLYFYDNAEIGFALRGYNGSGHTFTTLSHVGGNGMAMFEEGEILPSRTHYFSGSNILLPTNIPNYSFVSAGNIYSGISAQFRANGRQLIAEYNVEAGSLTEEITLHFDELNNTVLNAATGDAELTLAPEREILLHAARVRVGQGEEELVPFAVNASGDLVLDITDVVASGQSAVITVKITLAPYYHDYDAVADESENIVATSTGFNTMMNGADNSDADIIVTRLNSTGTEVLSTTIIAGEDEDVAYGVAIANGSPCAGNMYLTGLTKSSEFPVDGTRLGAEEAYVMRLNADATAVESGMIMAGTGRDVAHHVIICGCDVRIVGATDGGLADVSATEMDFTTTFPAVESSDKVQTYFLAYLNAEATEITNRVSFAGPAIGMPIKVGCAGGSVEVGVASGGIVTASCNANYTSEMSYWFDTPCRAVEPAWPYWGWHALCWKDAEFGSHTLKTTCPPPPAGDVKTGDEVTLNDREASEFDCGGCSWPDPWGVWHRNSYKNFSTLKEMQIAELALGAAYYQECCGSPVYANWMPEPPLSNTVAFLIRRVHLRIEDLNGNPVSLQNVCGTQFQNAKSGDMFDVACLTGLNGHIEICSMDVVPWRPDQNSMPVYPQTNWDVDELRTHLSPWGIYIADPPEDNPYAAGNIQEMAHRLSHSLAATTEVETVTYDNGAVASSTTATRNILMSAFHAPGRSAALPTSVGDRTDRQSVSSSWGALQSTPNPASGEVTITYQIRDAATLRLEVYNAMGQQIDIVQLGHCYPRQYSMVYDTSKLPSGTYYLHLSSEQGKITMPIVVAH